MQNLLGHFTGRCPNVRSLTLRKAGQRHLNEFSPEFIAKESDIYDEFGTFISSMEATLQHVIFERGARTALRHPLPPGQMFTPNPQTTILPDIFTVHLVVTVFWMQSELFLNKAVR